MGDQAEGILKLKAAGKALQTMRCLVELCCAPRTAQLPASTEEWQTIIHLALLHGVAPLLWVNLQGRGLPEELRTRLRAIYAANLICSLRLIEEQARVVAALESNGIRALPLKGPGWSELLYGEPGVRQSADLDVLVEAENLEQADALLGLLGYARVSPAKFAETRKNHELLYRRPRIDGPDFHLDLHQRLIPYGSRDPLAERVWREGMSPENLLLYLCVNQIVHRFSRLKHALDVAKFLQRAAATLNWDAFLERASGIAWAPGVAESLRWSCELCGVSVPQRVFTALGSDRGGTRLLRLALGGSAAAGLARSEMLEGPLGAMVILACTRPGTERLRQFGRLLFPPVDYLREQSLVPSTDAAATLFAKRLGRNLSVALRQLLLSGR